MDSSLKYKQWICSIWPQVRELAHIYSFTDEPDDLAQTVVLKLLEKQIYPKRIEGWLQVVVRNTARDLYRRYNKQTRLISKNLYVNGNGRVVRVDDPWVPLPERGQSMRSDEPDEMDRMKNALGKLKPEFRQVLVMKASGMTMKQIASRTKTPMGTVRSRLHYAKRQAKKLLPME